MKWNNEIKIGMMVVIVLLILAGLTLKTGNVHFSQKGYAMKVVFKNIDGISTNSPVMLNGLEVGMVKAITVKETPEGTKMEVLIWVKNAVRLKEDTKAYVKNLGFMGEKYVGLISSGVGENHLAANSVIIGQEPADFNQILTEGQAVAVQLKEISQNINERLNVNKTAIDQIIANVNTTTKSVASITGNVDERLKVNQKAIDEIVESLEKTSGNLEELSEDLKANPWKLLYKEKTKKSVH
ncbi:MAG: MCE family protein [Candidatus Omnitrophica bacterium]|nr:MCE family protein [Candidatus Omnitrophota bacterium]